MLVLGTTYGRLRLCTTHLLRLLGEPNRQPPTSMRSGHTFRSSACGRPAAAPSPARAASDVSCDSAARPASGLAPAGSPPPPPHCGTALLYCSVYVTIGGAGGCGCCAGGSGARAAGAGAPPVLVMVMLMLPGADRAGGVAAAPAAATWEGSRVSGPRVASGQAGCCCCCAPKRPGSAETGRGKWGRAVQDSRTLQGAIVCAGAGRRLSLAPVACKSTQQALPHTARRGAGHCSRATLTGIGRTLLLRPRVPQHVHDLPRAVGCPDRRKARRVAARPVHNAQQGGLRARAPRRGSRKLQMHAADASSRCNLRQGVCRGGVG